MTSFASMATESMTTQREPDYAGGKIGNPVDHLTTAVPCLPVMPLTIEVAASLNVENPFEVCETYVDGDIDVKEGDLATIAGQEYQVFSVGDWPWVGATEDFKHLILREIKK